MHANHELVSIDSVKFDITNPRISKFLEMYESTPGPEEIYLALGAGVNYTASAGTSFSSLKESIRTNRGIIQPIIINRLPEGQMIVLEGNTRLAIYQQFYDETKDNNWLKIPSVVYENLSQEQQDSIRLQAHLVGPRQWEPYAKGKYLHYLRTKLDFPLGKLIDYCGGRKKEVEDYIQAYIDIEKYYRPVLPEGAIFDSSRFSGFVELQHSGIKEAILRAGYSLEDFGKWIDSQKLYPLNTVRQLPKILANPKSKDVFLDKDAKEALKALDTPEVKKVLDAAKITDLARALVVAYQKLSHSEFKKMQGNPDGDEATIIAEAYSELSTLYNDIFSE